MGFFGGDPPGMRVLASRMELVASQLRATERNLGSDLMSTDWTGPDADRYREKWSGEYATALLEAARDLNDAARNMRSDADKQDQASGTLA